MCDVCVLMCIPLSVQSAFKCTTHSLTLSFSSLENKQKKKSSVNLFAVTSLRSSSFNWQITILTERIQPSVAAAVYVIFSRNSEVPTYENMQEGKCVSAKRGEMSENRWFSANLMSIFASNFNSFPRQSRFIFVNCLLHVYVLLHCRRQ